MINALWQDLRYGTRKLFQSPGFMAVVILTLALGIGANTVIFSVVNAVLFRPLPFKDPDRLVMLWGTEPQVSRVPASLPDFLDWRDQNQVFEAIAAYDYQSFNLTGVEDPERIPGAVVSASLFPLLGVNPSLGRPFLSEENRPGANPVVIVSHGLWQRRFGSDPNFIGQTLILNGRSHTVVGIMPTGFQFPEGVELWAAMALADAGATRGTHYLSVIARLKPGVTLEQAQADMSTIARRLEQAYPDTNTGVGVILVPLHEQLVGNVRPALLVLLGAVGFVLLIACVNIANLLLARATGRQREMAIRAVLGASRPRLVQQLLTEGVLLSLFSGAVGLLLAFWGSQFFAALMPGDIPRVKEIRVDDRVLGFTLALSLMTGLVFGVVPALPASRPDLNEALKEGGGRLSSGFPRHRVRGILVVSEITLALVLLIGAGLMIKSFLRLREVKLGFDPQNVLTMQISPPESRYPTAHHQAVFFQQVLQRVRTLPGARSAGVINDLPLSGGNVNGPFTIEGRPPWPPGKEPIIQYRLISHGYFRAMGIPLVQGRDFTDRDTENAPAVVIINETMARRFWPDEDPMGKRIKLGGPEDESPWFSIVGVAGDVRHFGLEIEPKAEAYFALPQNIYALPSMTLVVRTAFDPLSIVGSVRHEIKAVDKDLPVYNVRTIDQIVSDSVSQRRFNMLLLGLFAAMALILAAVGVYGVTSYSVTQRTHEIGIRLALGAEPSGILKLVIGQAMVLTLVGIAIGVVAAVALTRFMSSLLYGVRATDPVTFVAVSMLLIGVTLLASYVPARRATKVDPMTALRYE